MLCLFDIDAARGLLRELLEEHHMIRKTIQISGIVFFVSGTVAPACGWVNFTDDSFLPFFIE